MDTLSEQVLTNLKTVLNSGKTRGATGEYAQDGRFCQQGKVGRELQLSLDLEDVNDYLDGA